MKLNTLNGKNFKTVIDQLIFHDCNIINIIQSDDLTSIDIDYYNWEEAEFDNTAPWYTLRLRINKLIKFEFYNPDPGTFSYEISFCEYDIHLNEIEQLNKTTFTLNEYINSSSNFLSVVFHTHCSKDIEYGYNGYLKIFGLDCKIDIIETHKRSK